MAEYPWAGMDPWNLVLLGEAKTEMYRQIVESLSDQQ